MTAHQKSTVAYAAPFAAFVGLMAIEHALGLSPRIAYPVRCLVVAAILLFCSRSVIPLRPSAPLASVAVGVVVFLIWIGPDLLFGPAYRHSWIFENGLTGKAVSSMPPGLQFMASFLIARTIGSVILVPILEELFWRGWLMRWIAARDWLKEPIGLYVPYAFWIVAVLFASEHGPYWEVGLAAGIIYNLWVIRTRNLADCMLAHAVTNGLLAAYVMGWGQWQYWL
ncbi:MAG TPA: CAAX prenyl protease-related protein [Bryobacteraceae bacterium]|nr:CAAX prenyl protease-related protein [Bryobacteraceae bacterium]